MHANERRIELLILRVMFHARAPEDFHCEEVEQSFDLSVLQILPITQELPYSFEHSLFLTSKRMQQTLQSKLRQAVCA